MGTSLVATSPHRELVTSEMVIVCVFTTGDCERGVRRARWEEPSFSFFFFCNPSPSLHTPPVSYVKARRSLITSLLTPNLTILSLTFPRGYLRQAISEICYMWKTMSGSHKWLLIFWQRFTDIREYLLHKTFCSKAFSPFIIPIHLREWPGNGCQLCVVTFLSPFCLSHSLPLSTW